MGFIDNILGYITDTDFTDPANTGLLEDAYGLFTNDAGDFDWARLASAGTAAGVFMNARNDAPPQVGFQGSIPDLKMERQALPGTNAPDRRPGSGGQRFFTDPEYTPKFAEGGIAELPAANYLRGGSDGMADEVPTTINGRQEAALSDGEFVMPADVVSHLGNGNSDAGAKVLYDMMDRIRKARTGSEAQGKQIDPSKFMPGSKG